jgi:hypothetical protein
MSYVQDRIDGSTRRIDGILLTLSDVPAVRSAEAAQWWATIGRERELVLR